MEDVFVISAVRTPIGKYVAIDPMTGALGDPFDGCHKGIATIFERV